MKCLVCEVGNLRAATRTEALRYRNRTLQVHDFCFSSCDQCGAELVMPEQAKRNQVLMADAVRRVEGLLTSQQIKEVRQLMDVNRSQASKIFGGGPNAFSKYERGEIHPSEAVNKLMILARDVPEVRRRLLHKPNLQLTTKQISSRAPRDRQMHIRDQRQVQAGV